MITGAARRIGRAISMALALEGYDLILHYNRSDLQIQELVRELKNIDINITLLQADFNHPEQVQKMWNSIPKNRKPTVLINNASIFYDTGIHTMGIEDIDRHLRINFSTAYLLTKLMAAENTGGNIINILDTRIVRNDTNYLDYALSKKLLWEFTRISARILAPTIRVNGIAPGLILPPPEKALSYLKNKSQDIPLKRHGEPANITQTINFLLANHFITGQIIYVDGGEHLL